jgi:hypothetical protein
MWGRRRRWAGPSVAEGWRHDHHRRDQGRAVGRADDEELAARKADWKGPRETIYATGALWKYAQLVGEARWGAVTHPGGGAEKHVYADI